MLSAITVDTMTHTTDAAQLLDIEMKQISWASVFVTHDGRQRIQIAQAADPVTPQNATDSSWTQTGLGGDTATGPTLAAKSGDLFDLGQGCGAIQAVWARAAIRQPAPAVATVTTGPLGRSARADFELGCSRVQSHPVDQDSLCQRLSTVNSKSCILVNVHSISRENVIALTISISRSGRMDNLLKDHS
jgi:hypothetical protein